MQLFVAIPTYKRLDLLTRLVRDFIDEASVSQYDIFIHIYDNDSEMSASGIIKDYPSISYISYPIKGLANIRNKIIDDYKSSPCNRLLMIDDDQQIQPGFLNVLFGSAWILHFDVISANIGPKFLCDRPAWSYNNSVYWDSNSKQYGEVPQIYGAGCVIFGEKLKQTPVRFRVKFNTLGGEDAAFFYEIKKEGFSFYVAKELLTYEIVGPGRATYKWFVKRCLRIGVSEFFIVKYFNSSSTLVSVAKSVIIVTCLFPIFVIGLIFKRPSMNKYVISCLRHVGRIMASLGFVKDAY